MRSDVISPDLFRSLACPTYPEIRLALSGRRGGRRADRGDRPDALHIATEGPLGLAARRWCVARRLRLHHRLSHPVSRISRQARPALAGGLFWRYIRWFHRPARGGHGLDPDHRRAAARRRACPRPARWGRGVDLDCFGPAAPPHPAFAGLPTADPALCRPRRGREEYRGLPRQRAIPGPKSWSVTARRSTGFADAYPDALFLGALRGEALASAYARRRRLRLSEPHRHVRPGDDRGARQRHAGRRLSGAGADRRARPTRSARWTRISTRRSPPP